MNVLTALPTNSRALAIVCDLPGRRRVLRGHETTGCHRQFREARHGSLHAFGTAGLGAGRNAG